MSMLPGEYSLLLAPDAYPEATGSVDYRETHISRVFLTDSRAYKLKKPLDLGFLDFSTLVKRRHFCHEEVRLNRRFTRDLYLGVVELHRDRHGLNFRGSGELADYAVCMRRLPEERMLDRMLDTSPAELAGEMPRLASHLHTLFGRADVCRGPHGGNAAIVATNCRDNFTTTAGFSDSLLSPQAQGVMLAICERDLTELHALLCSREADGMVRDGHGDLHSGNICMTESIQVYDCIEFNRAFRVADIAADLAFLLMDLDFANRRDLSALLLQNYQSAAGDRNLEQLLPFYQRYRAWVRGKVDGLLALETDVEPPVRHHAAGLARRYFNLAMGYTLSPTLLLTCGLMGSGKTTLARGLASVCDALLLRSDTVRKELAGLPPDAAVSDAWQQGLYAAAMTDRTYRELHRQAALALAAGRTVIVDAAFSQTGQRQLFCNLGRETRRPVWLLHLDCPEPVARQRLAERHGDASDGRPELLPVQQQAFAPVEQTGNVINIDSTREIDYTVHLLLCRILSRQEMLS
ncbi:MAG: AAA family ATPase [Desulfuromonadales bacterium]|nr:AAA family ATPase [Desulfuromonadales bacterium]